MRYVNFSLRMKPEVARKLRNFADSTHRSMANAIVHLILIASIETNPTEKPDTDAALERGTGADAA